MKKAVVMTSNGVMVVNTVKEAVALLATDGITVTQKAILSGSVNQVQMVDESEVAAIIEAAGGTYQPDNGSDEHDEPTGEDEPIDDPALTDKGVEDTDDSKPADTSKPAPVTGKVGKRSLDVGAVEYPEVGSFKDEKAMKKFTKGLTDAALFDWCELEGVEWNRCPEHAPIDRMRAAMAIKGKHFPDTAPKASAKSKSKYADYTTDQLIAMCLENDLDVTGDNGDMRILRMRAIMVLRAAKVIE